MVLTSEFNSVIKSYLITETLKKRMDKMRTKIRQINKNGTATKVYGYVKEDGSLEVGVDGAFNGLRHQNLCDKLRRDWELKHDDMYRIEN